MHHGFARYSSIFVPKFADCGSVAKPSGIKAVLARIRVDHPRVESVGSTLARLNEAAGAADASREVNRDVIARL